MRQARNHGHDERHRIILDAVPQAIVASVVDRAKNGYRWDSALAVQVLRGKRETAINRQAHRWAEFWQLLTALTELCVYPDRKLESQLALFSSTYGDLLITTQILLEGNRVQTAELLRKAIPKAGQAMIDTLVATDKPPIAQTDPRIVEISLL